MYNYNCFCFFRNFFSIFSASIVQFVLLMSAKTGIAPIFTIEFIVAEKVTFGTMTSSPYLISKAFKANIKATNH